MERENNLNKTKAAITDQLLAQLGDRGVKPRQEVRTAAGVADIVTDTAVYAVVPVLTEDKLRAATKHALAWRDALNPKLKAVVYGGHPGADPTAAMAEAKAQGVVVNFWKDGDKPGMQ